MTTQSIHSIKSSGGDYTSLSAWQTAQKKNLVTADQVEIAECYGLEDTTAVTLSGWTTDATRYVIIRTPSTNRHAGVWNTGVYRMKGATAILRVNQNYTVIDGIQIDHVPTAASQYAIGDGGTATVGVVYKNMILRGDSTGTYSSTKGLYIYSAASTGAAINCIGYNFKSSDQYGLAFGTGAAATFYLYNCTAYNCARGFLANSTATTAKNCLAQSCSDGFVNSFNAASTNNASDIASDAPTTNARTGTATFVSTSTPDFHLASGDTLATGYGADLSADATYPFNTDIDGSTITTWSIGGDALAGAAVIGITGTASVTLADATVLASFGGPSLTGTSSVTLDDMTVSASGGTSVSGTASVTLDDVTVSHAVSAKSAIMLGAMRGVMNGVMT